MAPVMVKTCRRMKKKPQREGLGGVIARGRCSLRPRQDGVDEEPEGFARSVLQVGLRGFLEG